MTALLLALALQGDLDRLIRELGSPELQARANAEAGLKAEGRRALAALEGAARHGDPEIRARAAALVEDISWDGR